jgi:hypothetical protein
VLVFPGPLSTNPFKIAITLLPEERIDHDIVGR